MLDTPEQIIAQAQKIRQVTVDSTYMPLLVPGVPAMTPEQRARLGAWVAQGARGP